MKAANLLCSGLFFVGVSCERHDWEETKILHEEHGSHGDHDGHEGGHGDNHVDTADDVKAEH